MKVFAKPISISSPGRTDEFPLPPPLMSFPRSKSSRGSRSRANPMFVRKINTTSNEEPSSPKVTCIGQVRARRRSSSNNKQTTTASRRCRWLRKLKPKCFRRVWRRSLSFLRCDYGGKSKKLQESEQIETNQKNEYRKREIEHVIGADNEILISESPPRNAFLLTRSRSAPYRSSYSSSKNWDVTMEKTGEEREDDEIGKKLAENVGIEEETEAINGEIGIENGEEEGSINGVEEFKAKPLNLSRCKSVPARTGDKLFMSFCS
ncbi:hypothetical protein L6452_29296 [Arctium lappa]|uniref:Uncharacterized protein n=1 Tax=Arctium lappa TaxID=4217 RepID=A0ACB8ZHH8_ARCLA|nr:hypothetical protein L6452_29296 [Arctium lappa]